MSFIRPPGLKITTQMTTLEGPHRTSMNRIALLLLLLILAVPAAAQELDCNVTIDMEQLTSEARENLAEFVSQSVSSQSQSLGTGGPSQNISATI